MGVNLTSEICNPVLNHFPSLEKRTLQSSWSRSSPSLQTRRPRVIFRLDSCHGKRRNGATSLADWSGRMQQMADFVGLTAEERELVRSTSPHLLKHADELTGAIYDHFLKFPDAARFFLTETGPG